MCDTLTRYWVNACGCLKKEYKNFICMSSDKTYSKTAVADAEFCSTVKSEFMKMVKWKCSRGRD